jgi:hypothetical protein
MNKYLRTIRAAGDVPQEINVDVYAVLDAFGVANPAVQHAIKKLLAPGQRGAKSAIQDLKEARASIDRAIQMEETKPAQTKTDVECGICGLPECPYPNEKH